MKITTSGIDVAKSVFQVHGVDEHGKVTLRRYTGGYDPGRAVNPLVLEGQFVNRGESKPPDRLSVFGIFPNNTNIRVAVRYEF